MTTTKEPSKDFRQALMGILKQHADWRLAFNKIDDEEATTRILALCKEMLVPAEKSVKYLHRGNDGSKQIGWNACRSELLKQLGRRYDHRMG